MNNVTYLNSMIVDKALLCIILIQDVFIHKKFLRSHDGEKKKFDVLDVFYRWMTNA